MLSVQNIESELSYAYLHAIASHGGFSCYAAPRHLDSSGVDAIVSEDGRVLDPVHSLASSFEIHIQLKATKRLHEPQNGRFAFSLDMGLYNKLRSVTCANPRFLVVLFLPQEQSQWLTHSLEGLIARRCAYWVSLRQAPEVQNSSTKTVYIPVSQHLSPDTLTEIMTRVSRGEEIDYVE